MTNVRGEKHLVFNLAFFVTNEAEHLLLVHCLLMIINLVCLSNNPLFTSRISVLCHEYFLLFIYGVNVLKNRRKCMLTSESNSLPWPVWLSWLGVIQQSKRFQSKFQVWSPLGVYKRPAIDVPLSFLPPFPLYKNK